MLLPLKIESSENRFEREAKEGKRHWNGDSFYFKRIIPFPNRGEKVLIENCKIKYLESTGIHFATHKNVLIRNSHFYPIKNSGGFSLGKV